MPRSSGISAKPQTAADFFATDGHYRYLAGRISSTLSEGRFVLVIGDPPASPEMLCRALTSAAAAHHAAISILCPRELERAEPLGAISSLAEGSLSGGATGARELSINRALFVLAELDGLPDKQIKHICEAALLGAGTSAMGVVLAGSGFLARLEGPALAS